MTMATTVLDMSLSIDGFIAGPNETMENGLGDGGERLHDGVFTEGGPQGVDREVIDEMMSTAAIVAGRGTFEPAGGWRGDHHDGAPIFIYSRREPGIDISGWPLVTYTDELEAAFSGAREAAGDGTILVHGAAVAQLAFAAGQLDELELHVVPVLLGQGRRLFEGMAAEQIALERTRVLEGADATHVHYGVIR
jgi:dihydrofolate reductase